MQFEEILARCLEALDRGETIDQCLARYPAQGSELEPLLRLAVAVRSAPRPRLSTDAYTKGRAALHAQAHYQQSLQAPFQNAQAHQNQPPLSARRAARRVPPTAIARSRIPHVQTPGPALFLHRATGLFVSLMVLLCVVTLLRNVAISLPGSSLYSTKRLAETVQGALLIAAGEPAAWYAHQTETRLRELFYLTNQGQPVTPDLMAAVDASVQATLAASAALPADQRSQFLITWTDKLQTLDMSMAAESPATLTLRKTIATVQAATAVTNVPTTLPATNTPSPTETATPAMTNTVLPLPTATVATATPLPTLDVVGIPLAATATYTLSSISTPTAPDAFATNGSIEVRMPEETPVENQNEANDDEENATGEQPDEAAPPEATSSFGTAPINDFNVATATDTVQQAESNRITQTIQLPSTLEATREATTPTAEGTATSSPTETTSTPDPTVPLIETPTLSLPTATDQTSLATWTPTPQPTKTPTPMRTVTPARTAIPADTPTPKEPENTPTNVAPTDTPTAQRTPTKEVEKTVEPTELPEATETLEIEDTPKPDDTPEPIREVPTLQPLTSPISVSTPEATKHPGKK